MYRFQCDYTEGAHPAIMQRMVETNMEQTDGYGLDPYCDSARQKIKDLCECQDADVHFLVGGTQTNTTVISAALRPYQGAVAAVSGHINVHETGAIEATGHKSTAASKWRRKDQCRTGRRNVSCSFYRWKSGAYGAAGNGIYFPPYREWNAVYKERINGSV